MLFFSITRKHFSTSIKNETLKKSMMYLLTLMLILGSAVMTKKIIDTHTDIRGFNYFLTKILPDFELYNGRFICYGNMPFIFKADKGGIIIDTTGVITEEYMKNYKAGIIITASQVIVKNDDDKTTHYNLSQYKDYNFTKTGLINFINNWTVVGLGIYFVLGVCYLFILKIIGVFTLSLISLVVCKISRIKLPFRSIFQISIYAIALPTIIDTILRVFNIEVPYFWIIYYAIATLYIFRYIKFSDHNNDELILNEV